MNLIAVTHVFCKEKILSKNISMMPLSSIILFYFYRSSANKSTNIRKASIPLFLVKKSERDL